jgi:arylsulfatase A-like enzyme
MLVSRRHFLQAGLAVPVLAAEKPAAPRPNVLLVTADNLPAWVLGCYGNKEVRTPSVDRLAQVGTRFLNHVACAPAPELGRATLLTGRTPMQLGDSAILGAGDIALDKLLGGLGYTCEAADSSADAVKLLGQHTAGKPFLLTVTLTSLRPPYEGVAQKFRDMYARNVFENFGYQTAAPNARLGHEMLGNVVASLRQYAAAVSALDEGVGAVLAALGQRQLLDSTLVIFTSTCGALLGRHGLWEAAEASDPPNMYQETTVTPMIWSWPVRIPTQLTRPELVSAYDLLPTVCEIVSVAPPARNLCGRSYLALATGKPLPKKDPWRTTLYSHYRNTDMARDRRYKVVVRNGASELYDLVADPGEQTNQYDNGQFVTSRDALAAEVAGWKRRYSS